MAYDASSGEFLPQLAESLEPNADLTEWVLTLREGVVFGSGNPVTAEAVIASIGRHQTEGARLESLAAVIDSMEAIDARTVKFALGQPALTFPVTLSGPIGMVVDPAIVEERGDEGLQSDATGAGAGPYELVSYAPDEELILKRKDDYWGGEVCVETLKFKWFESASVAYDAFENGEFDVAYVTEPLVVAEARDAGYETHSFEYGLGSSILINAGARGGTPPTTDVRLRRAIAHAIDPEFVNDRAFEGTSLFGSTIFAPDMLNNPGVDGLEFDPELATQLLDEVKADTGFDGELSLVCPGRSQESGIAVKALLENVGFTIDFQVVDIPTLVESVMTNADFELACWQFSVSDVAPWNALEAFGCDSGSNRGGYCDPAMDAAIDDLEVATSDEAQHEALAAIQEAWNDTVPAANMGYNEDMVVWSDEIDGLKFSVESLVLLDDLVVTAE